MTVNYDFLLQQIAGEIEQIEGQIAAEKLAGNPVKEAAEQGEKTAFLKMEQWVNRLKTIEAT